MDSYASVTENVCEAKMLINTEIVLKCVIISVEMACQRVTRQTC